MSFDLAEGRRKDWFWCYDAIFDTDLSYKAKLVYLYLCRRVDGARSTHVGQKRIAKETGLGMTSIRSALVELRDSKAIQVESRKNADGDPDTNIYTLLGVPQGVQEMRGGVSDPDGVHQLAREGPSPHEGGVPRHATTKDYTSEGIHIEGIDLPRQSENGSLSLGGPPVNGNGHSTSAEPKPQYQISPNILRALDNVPVFARTPGMHDPAWWRSQVLAYSLIDHREELYKMGAWIASNPKKAPRKDLRRFVSHWFAKANSDVEVEA